MESLKNRYPDWDEPAPGNEALCRKFSREIWRSGNLTLPYRLFCPAKTGEQEKIPLVLYLHGADVVGDDNERHLLLHDIGTVYVRDDWQERHPCAVLAPQYGKMMHWARHDVQEALEALLAAVMGKHPEFDAARVYIYGYSAGGVGTLELLKRLPETFAGAVVICGATYQKDVAELVKTPIWMLHAEDDRIVSPNRSPGFGVEYLGSTALYEMLSGEMGERLHYTRYRAGELMEKYGLNPHCAWVPAGADENVKYWLFSQRRG